MPRVKSPTKVFRAPSCLMRIMMFTLVGISAMELMAEPEAPETIDLDSMTRSWLALSRTLFRELLL